jgi:hypothetical protein
MMHPETLERHLCLLGVVCGASKHLKMSFCSVVRSIDVFFFPFGAAHVSGGGLICHM